MTSHYSTPLVLASLLISILACWMALELSCRVHAQRSRQARAFWLGSGAAVMGLGIWAMHYIGMLAYHSGMSVFYHWPTVLASFVAAALASALALFLVSRARLSWMHTSLGGIFMGGGIAAMHYIGMAAMRMPCSFTYDLRLVALSLFLAVSISMVALRLCFSSRSEVTIWSWRKAGSALLMGMAVPSMHYVGMAAVRVGPMDAMDIASEHGPYLLQVSQMGSTAVICAVLLCLGVAMLIANMNRSSLEAELHLEKARLEHERLNSYQQRLVQAYRQNGVGAWEWDPVAELFSIDPSLRKIYDLDDSEEEHSPRSLLLDRMHPADVGLLRERWQAALAEGNQYENEYRIVHRNGQVRRCRSVATVNRDATGKVVSVVGMSWDVTAERQQEADSAEQARRFYLTLEAIGDAVLSTDAQHRIVYANPVACALTGWAAQECVGRLLTEVFIAKDGTTGELRGDPINRCAALGGSFLNEDAVLVDRRGKEYNIRKHVNLVDDHGSAVITFQDITASRQLERDLQQAATHDSLTGLPNRSAFEARLKHAWLTERSGDRRHCLALLDLDRFKLVNDTSGHLAGDALLREIVAVLKAHLPANAFLARMGGDEFLLLLQDTTPQAAEAWAAKLLLAVQDLHFMWLQRAYSVTASMGMVFFDAASTSLEALTSQADVAMFTSKRKGRNQCSTFQATSGEAAGHMLEMETVSELRLALTQNRLELHAQPIVPLHRTKDGPYFELLVRMLDNRGAVVPPSQFIPAAECYGMMHLIDRWVIEHALAMHPGNAERPVRFAINLSAESLSDPTLWSFVYEQFQSSGTNPASITFEVTESGLIQNLNTARAFLNQAKQAGCRVALDDFGTGMSSLSYLKHFPLDVIKIDGSFVRKLLATPLDQTIVRAIAQIAHGMNATTIAECAEDMETVDLLSSLAVDYVQGWATGRPEPLTATLQRLRQPSVTATSAERAIPIRQRLSAEIQALFPRVQPA